MQQEQFDSDKELVEGTLSSKLRMRIKMRRWTLYWQKFVLQALRKRRER